MFKHLDAKPRLLISVTGSILIYLLTPKWLQLSTRILIGWNFGVVSFLVLVWLMMSRATSQRMRSQAQRQDQSRWIILIMVVVASCASLLAIIFMLNGSKHLSESILTLYIIFSLLTIVASWLLIHTMFALHYAHLYYQIQGRQTNYLATENQNSEQATPLEFPQEKAPNYADFLYFSLGIGMTSQVADVQIISRILRRLALVHEVLSFFFNTLIVALGINILASLI